MASSLSLEWMRDHLYAAVVSDALDSLGFTRQSPDVHLAPLTSNSVLVGRCKTTLWVDMAHEDPHPYDLELKAVDSCRPDEVLIAAAGGSMRSGIWGELLTTAAKNRGCIGAIVDGAVRDVSQMKDLDFPVFARGTRILDSLHRQRVVDIDVSVEVGGVLISPMDLVVADADGIVIVPQEVEQEALERAAKKVLDENRTRDAIRDGMLATEAFQRFGVL